MYVNPYSGEEVKNIPPPGKEKLRGVDYFFGFMLDGHLHLWLPHEIGKLFVDFGTLIFLFLLITGVILWWPKNKLARKQRLRFQWKPTTRWRRKNYDLHNVLGFYMTWIAIFLTITGLVMSFGWFKEGWYFVLSGGEKLEIRKPPNYKPISGDPLDIVWARFNKKYPDFDGWIQMYYSTAPDEAIFYRADPMPGARNGEDAVFNPYTLDPLGSENPFADAILTANVSIHVGEIGGLPTKILAFFASLIAASLPLTGFYIWWGRRNKSAKAGSVKPART